MSTTKQRLLNAIEINDTIAIRELLRTKANVYDPEPGADGKPNTCWGRAVRLDRVQVVKLLLAHKVNVDTCGLDGRPAAALRWASRCGQTEMVHLLLFHNADVHADQNHSLRIAAYNGHAETVRALLKHRADVHTMRETPLYWAVNGGHVATVQLLLNNKADVRVGPFLDVAVKEGFADIARLLLSAKAIIEWRYCHFAAITDHREMVCLLLKNHANPRALHDTDFAKRHLTMDPMTATVDNVALAMRLGEPILYRVPLFDTSLFRACVQQARTLLSSYSTVVDLCDLVILYV